MQDNIFTHAKSLASSLTLIFTLTLTVSHAQFIALFTLLFLFTDATENFTCDIVMVYFPPVGISLYAGVPFHDGDIVDSAYALPVHADALVEDYFGQVILTDYLEEHNKTHDLADFGYNMMFNHAPSFYGLSLEQEIVRNYSDTYFGDTQEIHFISKRDILVGDQMFIDYGDEWFTSRKFEEIIPEFYPDKRYLHIEDIHHFKGRIPGCMTKYTNIFFDGSYFGIEAARDIKKGTVIEVSRALFLPKAKMDKAWNLKRVLWQKPISPDQAAPVNDSRYSLLVLGRGTLYSPKGKRAPNVAYSWWFLSEIGLEEPDYYIRDYAYDAGSLSSETYLDGDISSSILLRQRDLEKIHPDRFELEKRIGPDGRHCKKTAFVAFNALRDIKHQEVLYIDITVSEDSKERQVNPSFGSHCF